MVKVFKNLDEQIEIMKEKGLTINNEEYAKTILLKENYFFLNAYRHLFTKSNQDKLYINGTTFEELYSLFLLDRNIRNILFKNISIIENNIKSVISYVLSRKYGYREKDYLTTKTFTNDRTKRKQVNDLVRKMKRQIRANAPIHAATTHYLTNYGYIPLWVLVKVLSFGIISETYTILKEDDKEEISSYFDTNKEDFGVFISILANYRNICAHEDIVFENKTQKYIENNIYHALLNIPKTDDEYIYGTNDLFSVVIMLKQLLTPSEFNTMINDIDKYLIELDEKVNTISIEKVLDRMGFPINWKELKEIEKKVI